MAEVDIQVKIASAKTIAEIERLKKELTSIYKATTLGTKENEAAAKSLVQVKEQLAKSSERVATANGKMMHSYFEAGEELRRFYREQRVGDRTMREAGNTVNILASQIGSQGLGKSVNTAFEAFQNAEFAINGMAIAAQSAGGKLATFTTSISAMLGPLTLVVAGISAVAMITGEWGKKMEETREAIKDYRVELGEISKLGLLNERASAASKTKLGFIDRIQAQAKGMIDNFSLSNLPQWGMEMFVGGGSYANADEAEVRKKAQLKAQLDLEKYYEEKFGMTITGTRGGSASPMSGRGGSIGGLSPADIPRFNQVYSPGDKIKMGVDSLDAVQTKVDGISSNIVRVGDVLAHSLTQGFMRGFETGQNLLKTFGDAVLASIMGIAAQQTAIAGVAGVLSLMPGVGTFSAIAKGLGSLFFNTSPTAGVDVTSGKGGVSSQLSAINDSVKNLSLRVDNQGIYMASVRGEAAFNRA